MGTPLPGFYSPMFADQIGQEVVMVGWGATGDLRGDGTGYDSRNDYGVRRKGSQMVSGFGTPLGCPFLATLDPRVFDRAANV